MTYRAAIYRHPSGSETVLTGPEHAHLPVEAMTMVATTHVEPEIREGERGAREMAGTLPPIAGGSQPAEPAMIVVEQLWPGDQAPGEWRIIGKARTWRGAERIARRHHDPEGFGGFRHPDGGPRYGTIRALTPDGPRRWDPALGTFA